MYRRETCFFTNRIAGMRIRVLVALCLASAFACREAYAQTPPPDILNAIVRKLVGTGKPSPTAIVFKSTSAGTSSACMMRPFDMQMMRGGNLVRSYSVLLNGDATDNDAKPKEFLAVLSRITIDADGSTRAYHPEDPDGRGICEPERRGDGRVHMKGICALDKFSSAGLRLFRNTTMIEKDDLVRDWATIWPHIRDRKLKPVELHAVAGSHVPRHFYLFYLPDQKLTAVFRENIITKDADGYPCRHGPESDYPGYFVAATTLNHIAPWRTDGCSPARFIDSETVPFAVLPRGGFGDVRIGDVMVARLIRGGEDRLVYGLIADAGPAHRLGEGSIALNGALLGKVGPVRSLKETWSLDISSGKVAMLVFGGTRDLLNGNYSRQNVEAVARREFQRWGGGRDPVQRLDACIAVAPVNAK
jgi:hypothetical protein